MGPPQFSVRATPAGLGIAAASAYSCGRRRRAVCSRRDIAIDPRRLRRAGRSIGVSGAGPQPQPSAAIVTSVVGLDRPSHLPERCGGRFDPRSFGSSKESGETSRRSLVQPADSVGPVAGSVPPSRRQTKVSRTVSFRRTLLKGFDERNSGLRRHAAGGSGSPGVSGPVRKSARSYRRGQTSADGSESSVIVREAAR